MPRKTKESQELKNTKKSTSKSSTTPTTTRKSTTTKKSVASNKSTTKKSTTSKKSVAKKSTASNKTVAKKSTAPKKSAVKKSNKSTIKTVSEINNTLSTKKDISKKATNSKNKKVDIVEYYDLPYRYNQTIVKILAQTPTNLFVYWDISDEDRKNFQTQYGENFFEVTKPILIIYNDTLNYHYEVEINDFANSWYLHVSDSKCDYRIELGRRPITKTEKLNKDYFYISMSNNIESPNDKILFDNNQKMVYFRDVKTGIQSQKNIYNISLIRNMGKI